MTLKETRRTYVAKNFAVCMSKSWSGNGVLAVAPR
jgi:hypothetical protein